MNQDELCAPHRKIQANNISANGRLGDLFSWERIWGATYMPIVTVYKGSKLRMVCTNKEL